MKIYLLKDTRGRMIYDANRGFVIAAKSAKRAREIAGENANDEHESTWLSDYSSSCHMIAEESKYSIEKVILSDFRAG